MMFKRFMTTLKGDYVTYVKKIHNGHTCPKCIQVLDKMKQDKTINSIDNIVTIDNREHNSFGKMLAKKFKINSAPFFVITPKNQYKSPYVYRYYTEFKKKELGMSNNSKSINEEFFGRNETNDIL